MGIPSLLGSLSISMCSKIPLSDAQTIAHHGKVHCLKQRHFYHGATVVEFTSWEKPRALYDPFMQ